MKLGSLFDGIGGFPYSASKYGFEPVWASEIEPFPVKVTQKHFPGMKHLGDITKIDGAEIEPVDVVTFGSPCTRLSVAGRHDGFDVVFTCEGNEYVSHELYKNTVRATDKYQYVYKDTCPICGKELVATNESALFFHAIRIINEMRDATDGTYPRFAVWENVPGAFSSNKGEDFRAVLEEIAETEIPMPRSGKWANAGMVRTERVDIAWRVFDAQYWGVPQRRKRIFLVADFTGQCSGEILFVEQGLSGHITEGREARQETAGDVGTGIDMPIWDIGDRRRVLESINVAPSLLSKMGTGGNNVPIVPTHNAVTMRMREGCAGGGKGPLISEDKSLTLGCSNDQAVFTYKGIIPFDTTQITSPQNGNNPKPGDPCHPLCANAHVPSIAIPQTSYWDGGQISDCLDCSMLAKGQMMPEKRRFPAVLEPQLYDMTHADEVMRPVEKGIAPTLNSRMGTGGNQVPVLLATIQNATRGKSQNGLGISQDDVSYTLDSLGNHAVCIQGSMIGRADKNGPQGDGINEEVSFTLNTTDRHAVAIAFNGRQDPISGEITGALDTCSPQAQCVAYPDPANTLLAKANLSFRIDQDTLVAGLDCRNGKENGDLCGTLQAKANGGFSTHPVRIGYAVRRLTPTECLRLQGYPDWWLDIEGATDTAKYKAIGNSVAIPCVDFVMSGIARVLGRRAIT